MVSFRLGYCALVACSGALPAIAALACRASPTAGTDAGPAVETPTRQVAFSAAPSAPLARSSSALPSASVSVRYDSPLNVEATADGLAPDASECAHPWVLLAVDAQSAPLDEAVSVARSVAANLRVTPCAGVEPRAASDVCLLRVAFYGTKHFSREEQHKNRHAVAARCGSRPLCEEIARAFQAALPARAPSVRCTSTIPHSGSITAVLLTPDAGPRG